MQTIIFRQEMASPGVKALVAAVDHLCPSGLRCGGVTHSSRSPTEGMLPDTGWAFAKTCSKKWETGLTAGGSSYPLCFLSSSLVEAEALHATSSLLPHQFHLHLSCTL